MAVEQQSPPGPAAAHGPLRLRGTRSPLLACLLLSVVLAALSAAVLPTVPSYDPWSWIVWGREVLDPHLSFTVTGGPSWKPLPVLFTTVYGPLGGAAPTLWVITARAGGMMALLGAYRLAARLVGADSAAAEEGDAAAAGPRRTASVLGRAAAPVAGLVAAAGVLLTQEFVYYMFRGTSEPMLVGCVLWAIDRHLDRHLRSAFLLGVAASLIRPEAWPFVLLYGLWLIRRERLWPLVALGWAAIPLLWFVPPWVGSGQPFLAASHAKDYNGHLGSHPLLEVIRRGADLQVWPALVLSVAAVALVLWRRRGPTGSAAREMVSLAAGALAWWVLVVAMTLAGYPGLERFFLPAAAVVCVLAGVAVAWAGEALGAAAARLGVRAAAGAAGVVAAVLLVAVCGLLSSGRISDARAQEPIAARAVQRLDSLSRTVTALGGHHRVFPCRSSFIAVNHGVQTALAWKLHVTLGRVGTAMRHQGLDFVGPHDTIDGAPATISRRLTDIRLLRRVGPWRVYRVLAPARSARCVGR